MEDIELVDPKFWVELHNYIEYPLWKGTLARYARGLSGRKGTAKYLRRIFELVRRTDWGAERLERLHQKQRDMCPYCSLKIEGKFHIDHIIPLVDGGHPFSDENLAMVHSHCNLKKQRTNDPHYRDKFYALKRDLKYTQDPFAGSRMSKKDV